MDSIDIDKQAIVLLTAYFNNPGNDVSPLTPSEWKIFTGWLIEKGYTPASLLGVEGNKIIESWNNNKITRERLIALLRRGAQMSMALEKWSRASIWILTRSDEDYPKKLKVRLGTMSPPILFGTGNKKLLNMEGIAVIGSRNVTIEDLDYSRALGSKIAQNYYTVISGGAKGIDDEAMLGALENNGNVVGVLADGLFRKSLSQIYRKYLAEESLVLISPYYPEAGFSVGNAMGRNKYVYCLSEAAIVVHSGLKGGTWTGANENLNKKWVPLFVKENNDKESGNMSLINNGGKVFNPEEFSWFKFDQVITSKISNQDEFKISLISEPLPSRSNEFIVEDELSIPINKSIYEFFTIKLLALLKSKEFTKKELEETLDISSAQLTKWLLQSVKDKIIKKLSNPIRYTVTEKVKKQTDLFA